MWLLLITIPSILRKRVCGKSHVLDEILRMVGLRFGPAVLMISDDAFGTIFLHQANQYRLWLRTVTEP